jgi:hypothetical protein
MRNPAQSGTGTARSVTQCVDTVHTPILPAEASPKHVCEAATPKIEFKGFARGGNAYRPLAALPVLQPLFPRRLSHLSAFQKH